MQRARGGAGRGAEPDRGEEGAGTDLAEDSHPDQGRQTHQGPLQRLVQAGRVDVHHERQVVVGCLSGQLGRRAGDLTDREGGGVVCQSQMKYRGRAHMSHI